MLLLIGERHSHISVTANPIILNDDDGTNADNESQEIPIYVAGGIRDIFAEYEKIFGKIALQEKPKP